MTHQPPHAPGSPDDGRLRKKERRLVRRARPKAWLPFVVTAALGLALIAWALLALPGLPEQIPTHWGPNGSPDAWAGTSFGTVAQGALIGLGGTAGLAAVAALVPALSPAPHDRSGWARVRGDGLHFGMVSALGWISLLILLAAAPTTVHVLLGRTAGLPWWLMPLVFTVLMVGVFAALPLSMRHWHRWSEDVATELGHHASAQERAEEERWTATGMMNDPDEPNIVVNKREGYGVGTTVNIGSPGGRRLYRGFVLVFAVGLPAVLWITAWPG